MSLRNGVVNVGTAALAVALAAGSANAGNLIGYRTVALSGQQAPGAPAGVFLSNLFAAEPRLNAHGRVSFVARLSGAGVTSANDAGMYTDHNGPLGQIVREGDQASGAGAGVVHSWPTLPDLRFNSGGRVAFTAEMAGPGVTPGTNGSAVWSDASGALSMAARRGSSAPGLASSVRFGALASPSFNDAGTLAFSTSLTGSGTNSDNNTAVWRSQGGATQLVAQAWTVLPGDPDGVGRNLQGVVMNGAGVIAFTAKSNSFNTDSGIMTTRSGTLAWAYQDYVRGGSVNVINSAGDVAFQSWESSTLWAGGPNGSRLGLNRADGTTTSAGFANAGGGGIFVGVQAYAMNAQAERLAIASYTTNFPGGPATGPYAATWLLGSSGAVLLGVRGGQAEGAAPGQLFGSFSDVALNDDSLSVFRATLTGAGVHSGNNVGIWTRDAAGELSLLLRSGDLFDVDEDPLIADNRTIAGLGFLTSSGGADGRGSSLNNAGQLAVRMSFTDGSSGIFVLHIPAPGSAALLGVAGVVGLRRRRG